MAHDQFGDEQPAHDDEVDLGVDISTDPPRSLQGNSRRTLVAVVASVALVLLVGLIVFGLFRIFRPGPQKKTAEADYEAQSASSPVTPMPAPVRSSFPTVPAGSGCAMTTTGLVCPPRPGASPTNTPSPCQPNYHVVAPPGYAATCVPNQAPAATPAPPVVANAPRPVITLPPQTITFGSDDDDAKQAANDISSRGGSTQPVNAGSAAGNGGAAGTNAGGSPYAPPGAIPVIQNGKIVAYAMQPANGDAGRDAQDTSAFINAQETPDQATSTGAQGGAGGTSQQQSNPYDTSAARNAQAYGAASSERPGYVPIQTSDQLDRFTYITASLYSIVNSELPGPFAAIVTGPPVSCSLGNYRSECIPNGTWLYGEVDTRLVLGQSRMLGVIETMRFPNGREFDFSGSVADARGGAGMTGDVDRHQGGIFGAAALLTVLGAASAALSPQSYSIYSGPSLTSTISSNVGSQIASLGTQIIGPRVARPPTIILDPTKKPYTMQIWILHDLPLYRYEVVH